MQEWKVALLVGVYPSSYLWVKKTYELGYTVFAIHDNNCLQSEQYTQIKPYLSGFFCIWFQEYRKLWYIAKAHKVSLVIPHPCTWDSLIACWFINSLLKLPGVQYKAAKICWSKQDFAHYLIKHWFPRPKQNFLPDDIGKIGSDNIVFPCIVKPNFWVWSIGVKKIGSYSELQDFFLTKNKSNGYELLSSYDYYTIQTYVPWEYLWINGIISNWKVCIFNLWNLLSKWWNSPYRYWESYITSFQSISVEVEQQVSDLMSKLSLKDCSFMLELILNDAWGIESFIELNLRPAGMNSAYAFDKIYWFDNVWDQIRLLIPWTKQELLKKSQTAYNYILLKNFQFKPGKIRDISWPKLEKNILYFSSELQEWDIIEPCINTNIGVKNGQIVVIGKTKDEVQNIGDNFLNGVKIIYE